jgi:hypothetical protein
MSGYDPDFDFKGNADRLLLAVKFLADTVDLDGMVFTLSMTHSLGAVLDPTAYRDALQRGDMHRVESLVRALAPAMKVWREEIAPTLPQEATA